MQFFTLTIVVNQPVWFHPKSEYAIFPRDASSCVTQYKPFLNPKATTLRPRWRYLRLSQNLGKGYPFVWCFRRGRESPTRDVSAQLEPGRGDEGGARACHAGTKMIFQNSLKSTGMSNWILHRIWKYSTCCLRGVTLKQKKISQTAYEILRSKIQYDHPARCTLLYIL